MEFLETQRFRQWWLWLILTGTAIIPVITLTTTNKQQSLLALILTALLIPVLLLILFFIMRLETTIDSAGVHYRFFPYHLKQKSIPWEEIDAAYVRTYRPIAEYGGWGIRGITRQNRAFNVSGNIGLQIMLKNGNKLLIGTQKPDEIQTLLKYLGKYNTTRSGRP